jgi:thymidylate synthase
VDVKKDWGKVNQGDTPCLTQINGSIYGKKFYLTAFFRSQDMVHGWPRNAFALRKLQYEIARDSGYPLGALSIITHSAHVYGDDFVLVEDLIMKHYEKELGYTPAVHFDFDPRGNVVVEVIRKKEAMVWDTFLESVKDKTVPYAVAKTLGRLPKRGRGAGKLIRATLLAPDGGQPLKIFEGRTAQEVAWQITDWGYIRNPSHAMYIGLELQKAEEAIVKGKKYYQDPA